MVIPSLICFIISFLYSLLVLYFYLRDTILEVRNMFQNYFNGDVNVGNAEEGDKVIVMDTSHNVRCHMEFYNYFQNIMKLSQEAITSAH